MNPYIVRFIISVFSVKDLLKIIFGTILFILLLPLFTITILTNTGFDVVSDKLVAIDTKTHSVKLYYPNGTVYKELPLATLWPVHGVVTLEFGESDLPYQPFHTGIDIAGKLGDPVTPFIKGTVTYADEISWGYGKHIIIDNGNNVTSLYGHLSAIYVKKGDEVKPGDIIGREGSTGWSTGPHLHFEIRVFGIPVNPRIFVIGSL